MAFNLVWAAWRLGDTESFDLGPPDKVHVFRVLEASVGGKRDIGHGQEVVPGRASKVLIFHLHKNKFYKFTSTFRPGAGDGQEPRHRVRVLAASGPVRPLPRQEESAASGAPHGQLPALGAALHQHHQPHQHHQQTSLV